MPAVTKAAGQARQKNQAARRRATQRRDTISRASGVSFDRGGGGASNATGGRRRQVVNGEVISRRNAQMPSRQSQGSLRESSSSMREYLPTSQGKAAGSAVGALEAEYIGALLLTFITLFTDTTTSYSDKMLSIMKRSALLSILFFILALSAGMGPNMAKASKAFGALVVVSVLLNTASTQMLTELESFFKGNWTAAAGASSGNTSNAGTPAAAAGDAATALKNAFQSGGLPAALAGNPAILWLEQNGGKLASLPADLAKQLPGDALHALEHLLP